MINRGYITACVRGMTRNGGRLTLALAALLLATGIAAAEMVEVAPGVQVTKKTYANAPIAEQPFFGFADKTPEQRQADAKFIADVTAAAGSKDKAFDAIMLRGWKAVTANRPSEAARRFNQAYLLSPEQSSVYHGFATVAQARFNDFDFAEELFKLARKQPAPLKALNADYGRVLLMAKRTKDAQPVLEQAVIDTPDFGDAWATLAFARMKNGDNAGACAAADEASQRKPSLNASRDLVFIKRDAQCR